MRTRIPWPRLGLLPSDGVLRLLVADARKVTENYLRLVEKVNGRLSGEDISTTYAIPNSLFREANDISCYSLFVATSAVDYQFTLPMGNGGSSTVFFWSICEIQDFNSSRRTNGRKTQFGWNSAITAELHLNGTHAGMSGLVSTISRPARPHVDSSGSRGGLPDTDVILSAHDLTNGSYTAGQTCSVYISTTMPSNGGYLVYVFYYQPWQASAA